MKTLLNSTDNFGFYDNNQNVYDAYYTGTESYGFQESHIAGGQAAVNVSVYEPITIEPINFESLNPTIMPPKNMFPNIVTPVANPIMTLTPTTSYFPITQPIFTTPIPVAPVFTSTMKITVRGNVIDEYGDPLPIANISIDGKATAQTDYDGNFTIPNVLPTSIVRVTYMGMGDYAAVASQFPSKVQLKTTAIQLEGVTIIVPKKDTTVPYTAPVAKAGMSWLLWIALLAAGYKGMQYFKDDKPKTVKAKI